MSEETPTTWEGLKGKIEAVYVSAFPADVASLRRSEVRALIAEVERAAAAKALTDLADELSVPRKLWHGDSGVEVMVDERTLEMQKLTEWLRARAEALGLTAGQEGEQK